MAACTTTALLGLAIINCPLTTAFCAALAVIGVLVGLITTVPESRVAAVLTAFVPVSDPDLRYRLDMAHCNGMTRALIEQLRSLGGPYAVTVLPFLVKAEQDIGAGQSKLP
jgi:hypothetical protein